MKKVAALVVVVGVLASALAGCTAELPTANESPTPAGEAAKATPVVMVGDQEAGQPYFAALIQGELSLNDRNCFGLGVPGGDVTPVVFQKGTTVLADGSGISVPGYGEIKLGDQVSGGGGAFAIQRWQGPAFLPECVADTVYSVLLT